MVASHYNFEGRSELLLDLPYYIFFLEATTLFKTFLSGEGIMMRGGEWLTTWVLTDQSITAEGSTLRTQVRKVRILTFYLL